jgi:DNA-binding LacI/PurR family transcriptional regulator
MLQHCHPVCRDCYTPATTVQHGYVKLGMTQVNLMRSFNSHSDLRPEISECLWRIVRSRHPLPLRARRISPARPTGIVGLVVPQMVEGLFDGPFFPSLIQAVAEVCSQHHYVPILTLVAGEDERKTLARVFCTGKFDGLIVSSLALDTSTWRCMQMRRRPCVVVGRHPDYQHVPSVDVDNVAGAQRMTEYLLGLGHRRIAAIMPFLDDVLFKDGGSLETLRGSDRFEGYCRGLARAGLECDAALVAETDVSVEGGFKAMMRLLDARPTAVFAAGDVMAIGALKALEQTGRLVPDDVSVAGFGDIPAAALSTPSLTTVRQDVGALGRVAAEQLMTLLVHPGTPTQPRLLPTCLIVRGSTAFATETHGAQN